MKEVLHEELEKIKSEGLYRDIRTISSSPGREIIIAGKKYINFSSNNYLGLAFHSEVKNAGIRALEKYGCGSTSSRLVAGTLAVHTELEKKLAAYKRKESALVYPSGFQANIGVIGSLTGEKDCLVMDRLNHASLWDAAKISKARTFVYPHRDMNALEKVLKRADGYRRKLIVTDSVFSMDGDLAPLKEIAFLAGKYNCQTMIDEAHATGVFGETGAGLAEHFEVENKIDIIMGTLSKALGSQGGFVCGSKELIEYLVNRSRSFIYTTALSPVCAAGALAALDVSLREPQRRKGILKEAEYLRKKLNSKEIKTGDSASQIVPFMVGSVTETMKLSLKLQQNGIYAPAIRPPTVPDGECRLRFSLTAEHTRADINKLLNIIADQINN